MNKYRLAYYGEYDANYQCLNCKGEFIGSGPFNYCSNCGIKFDGEFSIKNPRYKISDKSPLQCKTEGGIITYSSQPILSIEHGSLCNIYVKGYDFSLRAPKQYRKQLVWYTYFSERLGVGSVGSNAVLCYKLFNSKKKDFNNIRLVLIDKDKRTIKIEKSTPVDNTIFTEEPVQIRASGVSNDFSLALSGRLF